LVVLKGNRLHDTDRGAKAAGVGALRVIHHPTTTIGGTHFFGLTDIRLEKRDMTPALARAIELGDTAAPVKFDTIGLKDAEHLDGAAVTIRFIVATLAYTRGDGENLRTIIGPADRGDDAEWSVVIKGNRLHDADGAKLTVTGRLRVIRHAAAVVGGVRVDAWVEGRVTEGAGAGGVLGSFIAPAAFR
jgi:hypothetical protein